MDVNLNAEVKTVGVPTTPSVVREDRERPQVQPVAAGTESTRGALDDKVLKGGKQGRERKLTREELEKEVGEIQKRFDAMGTRLGFTVNDEPDAVVVLITDKKTGEVVRQFPSEEVLALRAKLEDITGLLFDTKA
ncbi:MAG: flagellar protein FlaG [Desulfobulbaceae bacterium]|nr:flagellar protein FlaG [Desulfobulbaceae bacterium]